MKNRICMLGALLLMLTATSCRQETDTIDNYSTGDLVAFGNASSSFEQQFKVFWNGMNQNYCLFAYDRTFGLDWDAVYDEFLPKFRALDEQEAVSDKELKELVTELVSGLHDGHFYTSFLNYHTGSRLKVAPGAVAIQSRPDRAVSDSFSVDLSHYYPAVVGGNGEFKIWDSASSRLGEFVYDLRNDPNKGMTWINAQVEKLSAKAINNQITDHEAFLLGAYNELLGKLQKIFANFSGEKSVMEYNMLVEAYSYLNVPGLLPYDVDLMTSGMMAAMGVTQDNIVYFYMSDFALEPSVSDSVRSVEMSGSSANAVALVESVGFVWKLWFNSVQTLIRKGQLKGVIIDLRNNGGGLLDDFPYLVGSLLPSGSHQIGYSYSKRGVGRFDYSVNMPFHMGGYPEPHEAITYQPVVILTNCLSISMSEISTVAAKELLNACQIGTTTWGGLCALNGNATYGLNYAGHVGTEGKTAVFCNIPQIVFSDLNGKIYEGVGVKPDIELIFDLDLYKTENRDNQFERALKYIREKS